MKSTGAKKKLIKRAQHRAQQSPNGAEGTFVFERKKSLAMRRAARKAYRQLQRFNRRAVETLTRLGDQQSEVLDDTRRLLKQTQNRYADLYEFAPVGYVTLDGLGRIEEINITASTILGRARRALVKTPLSLYIVRTDIGSFMRHLFRCKQQVQRVETELNLKSPDGQAIPVLLSTTRSSTVMREGVVLYQTAMVDLSERKATEAALREAHEMLEQRVRERTSELSAANRALRDEISRRKGLEGQILEISDREQQRIGQEIHDGLCQHLTGVAFMARGTALRLKNHRVIDVADLEKLAELVNEGVTEARNISRGLHRLEIDSASLLAALRDLVAREIWKTRCRLEVKTEVNLHDDAVASHIYRLLREAVINAHKHAQAREIVVEIKQFNGRTVFSVTDDGIGIHAVSKNSRGLGFHMMKYRAEIIGARLKIESRKGGGTRVACYLPRSK
ncbi:MAG: ATP-binding protein [Chthoniobacterales bacterium]